MMMMMMMMMKSLRVLQCCQCHTNCGSAAPEEVVAVAGLLEGLQPPRRWQPCWARRRGGSTRHGCRQRPSPRFLKTSR
jgi:hypothetical protein